MAKKKTTKTARAAAAKPTPKKRGTYAMSPQKRAAFAKKQGAKSRKKSYQTYEKGLNKRQAAGFE